MGLTAELAEAARRAMIVALIAALKAELAVVKANIEHFEAILKTLQDTDSSLTGLKTDLNDNLYETISDYDLMGDTPWGGNKENLAATDLMTAKASKTLYNSDIDGLKTNIDTAEDTTSEKLTELYSKRDDLEDKIADLESQL